MMINMIYNNPKGEDFYKEYYWKYQNNLSVGEKTTKSIRGRR